MSLQELSDAVEYSLVEASAGFAGADNPNYVRAAANSGLCNGGDNHAAINTHTLPKFPSAGTSGWDLHPNVTYYGQSVTRDKLLQSKRKALAATPNYAQTLSAVTLQAEESGNVQVSFRKRSGAPNAQSSVQARLSLEKQGDSYTISLESDAPSDTRADDATTDCIAVALDVANKLPEVEKLFHEAGPDSHEGGLMYPEEDGHVGAALGFHHEDRFETVFNVDVDTTSGALTIAQYGTPLEIPKAAIERVRRKCKKPAR